jgi:hypothetical protein
MAMLGEEAWALAEALYLSACSVAEVIAWADAQILREDAPDWTLCEISLSQKRTPQEIGWMLCQLSPPVDRHTVHGLLVALLNDKLKGDRGKAGQVASVLFQLYQADEIEDPDLQRIGGWAEDALDLAEARHIVETPEQVLAKMANTLEEAAVRAGLSWSFSPYGGAEPSATD